MHGRGSIRSTPRWVKVFGIAGIVLLSLLVGVHLVERGVLIRAFGEDDGHIPPATTIEREPQQP